MTAVEAVVFDMDGLIFDSERVVQRSWNDAGEILGYGRIGEHIYNTLGFNVKRREQYFKSVYGADFRMEEFNQITRERFHEIVGEEGLGVKPGVRELLEYLKSRGIKTAVATSSRKEYSTGILTDAGLMGYFDGAVFGDMVENAKPDPEIYLKACDAIGAKPENSVALEDAPAGIRAAHAAGMTPLMIPDLVEPDEEIKKLYFRRFNSLPEVLEFLKNIE